MKVLIEGDNTSRVYLDSKEIRQLQAAANICGHLHKWAKCEDAGRVHAIISSLLIDYSPRSKVVPAEEA